MQSWSVPKYRQQKLEWEPWGSEALTGAMA